MTDESTICDNCGHFLVDCITANIAILNCDCTAGEGQPK